MSNECGIGVRRTLGRAAEDAQARRYKITVPELLNSIRELTHNYLYTDLNSHLCYKISGQCNILFL